jgi:two-component system, chemotaxis family, sensor kinase CheA
MINAIKDYMLLPKVSSEFETNYLLRMNRVAAGFLILHLPVFAAIAFVNGTGPLTAILLTLGVLIGPILAMSFWQSKRAISTMMGVAAMFMGGLLVHFGQGPVQIEMHFYFFVLIALLAVFANPMVIVAAAVTAALHHAVLWFAFPASIFNYEAPFWVVAVHATFVVLESVAACFIARSFFDNVIGLEKKVAARTAEVESRNRDMRMILDSVKQGFFTIDSEGTMSDERSAAVEQMFGKIEAGETFINVLRRHDLKTAEWLEFGLEEVFSGFLPLELTIDQLPSRLVVNQKSLSIQWNPLERNGEIQGLAVVVSDITAEVEREKLEADSKETMSMIEAISADRAGFLEFFQEAQTIIDALRDESRSDMVLMKRRIHTLKGNASIFGLQRVADACHAIEDYIEEHGVEPENALWTRMFGCWSTAKGKLRRLASEESSDLRISDMEFSSLLLGILNRESSQSLAIRVAGWRLEATEARLSRIADQAKRLAVRLGKGNIRVKIQSHNLQTEPKSWASFWGSLIHVVRNAVDHGLESIEDRQLARKSETGCLTLTTAHIGDRFIVSIADDGKGIDWEAIRALASRQGLPNETEDDLVNALFEDGLSTSTSVTDTSGRGVGMGALKAACDHMEGKIQVLSREGIGTEFRFSFPLHAMAPETHSVLAPYGVDFSAQLQKA